MQKQFSFQTCLSLFEDSAYFNLLLCICSAHLEIQGFPDLVSYRGPRSMVTVDMSVDSRSISRSIIGDDSVDVVPLWRSLYRPRWLSADIDSNTPTLHRFFIDISPLTGRYIGQYSIDMFFRHFVLISIDVRVHSAPLYRSSYQLMANIITTDSRSIVCRYLILLFHYCIILPY